MEFLFDNNCSNSIAYFNLSNKMEGEAGVCGGIVGGRVRFVWYAFFTIKNACLLFYLILLLSFDKPFYLSIFLFQYNSINLSI